MDKPGWSKAVEIGWLFTLTIPDTKYRLQKNPYRQEENGRDLPWMMTEKFVNHTMHAIATIRIF
jgi:hypothetical protein